MQIVSQRMGQRKQDEHPWKTEKKEGDKVRRGCRTIEMLLQMCFICCVLDAGDSYFTVLTLVSFTRAFVALTAVLKEGGGGQHLQSLIVRK